MGGPQAPLAGVATQVQLVGMVSREPNAFLDPRCAFHSLLQLSFRVSNLKERFPKVAGSLEGGDSFQVEAQRRIEGSCIKMRMGFSPMVKRTTRGVQGDVLCQSGQWVGTLLQGSMAQRFGPNPSMTTEHPRPPVGES